MNLLSYCSLVTLFLNRFIGGENCVLIAYGMTNAGKTHTIQGTSNNAGSLPRLVEEIFKREEILHEECELQLSILEIYQEDIYDLLDGTKDKKRDKLKIRDCGDGRIVGGCDGKNSLGENDDA